MELIVSLALFSVAVVVVLTLLSMGITAQRKVLALQNVQENARAILEFMSKEIRMGNINGIVGNYRLNITRSDGDIIEYMFTSNGVQRTNLTDNESGMINSDSVIVNGSFYANGIGVADNLEPKITISLSTQGAGSKIEEQAQMDLQTTLSQRRLDLP